MQLIIEIIVAFVGTMSFSALFSVPRKYYGYCGLTGAVGWGAYRGLLMLSHSVMLAVFLSAFLLSLLCRLLSARLRAPTTLFLLCGIFTLVPGTGIYYMARYLFDNELVAALAKGAEILKIALAITLGIIVAFTLPAALFGWGRQSVEGGRRKGRLPR